MGERYKMIPKESKALVKGEYGKSPAPISQAIYDKVLGDEKPITCRPADLIAPELESTRAKIKDYIEQDEDVLSYALLPQVAETFFKLRKEGFPAPEPVKEVAETKGQNGQEVIAAVAAAVAALGEEDGVLYDITSIQPAAVSACVLSGRLKM
jgi:oxaloacetate decarboxylase alpha subunit